MEGGNRTGLTPTTSDLPSPNSSCATIEHPQVIFPPELYDRIFFIVTPSGNRKGPGFIMGLAEAHNAETFRAGVCERLESRGEQVGFREIVAHIPVSYSHSPSVTHLRPDSSRKTRCWDALAPAPVF